MYLLATTRGVAAACGRLGVSLNAAASFDVFSRFEVTNYGLFQILFEPAPDGPDHDIDVCFLWILAQATSGSLLRRNFLPTSAGESKAKI